MGLFTCVQTPHPEEKGTTAKSGGLVGGLLFQSGFPSTPLRSASTKNSTRLNATAKGSRLVAKAAGDAWTEAKKEVSLCLNEKRVITYLRLSKYVSTRKVAIDPAKFTASAA